MNIKYYSLIFLLIFFAIAIACSKEQKPSGTNAYIQPINPNGDSELAVLMRAMYDDAARVKQQIASGKRITFNVHHEDVLNAHATEPEKAASAEYKAFARLYLESIKQLENASINEVDQLYSTMIQHCMNCHQSLCPGPIVKIKKLI